MPKEPQQRTGRHLQSARLKKALSASRNDSAAPAAVANQVEDVQQQDSLQSAQDELEGSRKLMRKKDKQALKHEIFLQRLEASRSPYSKSHERRLKRKAQEQIANGLSDMKAVISELDTEIPVAVQQSVPAADGPSEETSQRPKATSKLIGEGKGTPLTKSQRKKALQVERMRIPLILSTPEFSTNPFKTIRTHAQNTLIKHDAVA